MFPGIIVATVRCSIVVRVNVPPATLKWSHEAVPSDSVDAVAIAIGTMKTAVHQRATATIAETRLVRAVHVTANLPVADLVVVCE